MPAEVTQPQKQLIHDVIDFIKDFNIKPTNPHEVSAKIAAYFYKNQNINLYQIGKIISRSYVREYLTTDSNKLTIELFQQFIQELISLKIDFGRYSLDQLIPEFRLSNGNTVLNPSSINMDLVQQLRRHALTHNEARKTFNNNNRYINNYFELTDLMPCDDVDAREKLYSNEDFVIPPSEAGRSLVKVKLGHLYIEYCPGGKGSYMLSISIIDRRNKQLKPLLNYDGARYSNLDFHSLVPLLLGSFYPSMTTVRVRETPQTQAIQQQADAVKKLLIELSMGNNVSPVDFYTSLSSLLNLMEKSPPDAVQIQNALVSDGAKGKARDNDKIHRENSHQPKNDIAEFMQNITLLPRDINELAAKMAAYFYLTLGLTHNEMKYLIYEYFNYNNIDIKTLNSQTFVEQLINNKIDKNRYALKFIIPSEDAKKLFLDNCTELKNNQLPTAIQWPMSIRSASADKSVSRAPLDDQGKESIQNDQHHVLDFTQDNVIAVVINEINNIVNDTVHHKYQKQLAILDYLRRYTKSHR